MDVGIDSREIEEASNNVGKVITNVMQSASRDTKYMYYYEMDVDITDHSKSRSLDEIERALLSSVISLSDIYMLYALYLLRDATCDMVAKRLEVLKCELPDEEMKACVPTVGEDGVRNRMIELCQYGLVIGTKIISVPSKTGQSNVPHHNIYSTSHTGMKVLRSQLRRSIYDGGVGIIAKNLDIKMPAIAANICALQFLRNNDKIICTNLRGPYKDMSTIHDEFFSARVDCRRADGEAARYSIAFEPAYFVRDRRIPSQYNAEQSIVRRMRVLHAWCKKMEINGIIPNIVLIAENMSNMAKTYNIIRQEYPDILSYVAFTTETIMYDHGAGADKSACFLRIEVKDGRKRVLLSKMFAQLLR